MELTNSKQGTSGHSMSLPLFLTAQNKWPVGIAVFIATAFLYLTSNWFHLFPPRLLPMWWIDRMIPFLPNTVWIYMSEYIYFAVVYFVAKEPDNLNKYLYSFFAIQVLSVAIFWIIPTTYPRELFPLQDDLNSITYYAFSHLRMADSPANCCPSLHVSSVFLSSLVFLQEQRKKFIFFFIWNLLIAVSTLTTKQHYLVDVVTGIVIACVSYWYFYKKATYQRWS
ncbi:MAG: phosphatase PAP2 family protein [Bdellovibrio sp.]|nr:phosphatase PAP2 family protein [Bdellovibrio sp.]